MGINFGRVWLNSGQFRLNVFNTVHNYPNKRDFLVCFFNVEAIADFGQKWRAIVFWGVAEDRMTKYQS